MNFYRLIDLLVHYLINSQKFLEANRLKTNIFVIFGLARGQPGNPENGHQAARINRDFSALSRT